MLNEVKHLNAESLRCFAALNMTRSFIVILCKKH